MKLVPCRHATLDCYIEVIHGPLPQILHASLSRIRIVIRQSLELCPFVEKVAPMRQLFLGRDDQKWPTYLMFALEIAQKVDQSDSFA